MLDFATATAENACRNHAMAIAVASPSTKVMGARGSASASSVCKACRREKKKWQKAAAVDLLSGPFFRGKSDEGNKLDRRAIEGRERERERDGEGHCRGRFEEMRLTRKRWLCLPSGREECLGFFFFFFSASHFLSLVVLQASEETKICFDARC